MQALVAVAAGGMIGAVGRYLVMIAATKALGHGFPFGTLIVNVAGSFVDGCAGRSMMALGWNVSHESPLVPGGRPAWLVHHILNLLARFLHALRASSSFGR